MAGGKEEYNAFFYSLVSMDTQVCACFLLVTMFDIKHFSILLIENFMTVSPRNEIIAQMII